MLISKLDISKMFSYSPVSMDSLDGEAVAFSCHAPTLILNPGCPYMHWRMYCHSWAWPGSEMTRFLTSLPCYMQPMRLCVASTAPSPTPFAGEAQQSHDVPRCVMKVPSNDQLRQNIGTAVTPIPRKDVSLHAHAYEGFL